MTSFQRYQRCCEESFFITWLFCLLNGSLAWGAIAWTYRSQTSDQCYFQLIVLQAYRRDQKCSASWIFSSRWAISRREARVPARGSLLTPGLIFCQKSHSIHRSVVPRKRHLSPLPCLFSRSLASLLFFDSSRPSHFSPPLSPYHSITFPPYLSLSFST